MTMNDEITKEQIEILKHANKPESKGQFVGCGPDMERLVDLGMMRFLGKPSWCPDPFYEITRTGIDFLKTIDMIRNMTSMKNAQTSVIRLAAKIAKLRDKADKYDQLIKDLGVEMRDPNGTIWDEAKRLQEENDKLVHCLRLIRDNPDQGGYWCAEQAAWALRSVTPESMDSNQ